jgi:hypothetical protein
MYRKIPYTEPFKKWCKSLYPNSPGLDKALEEGSYLGEYIIIPKLTVDDILNAESLEDLKIIAEDIKRKRELFDHWLVVMKRG